MINFSQSREEEGRWQIIGPVDEIVEDEVVEVSTKSGTTRRVLVTKILSRPFPSRDNPEQKLVFASFRDLCWWRRDGDTDDAEWVVAGLIENLKTGTVTVGKADGTWDEVRVDKKSIVKVGQAFGTAKPIRDDDDG